LKKKKIEGKKRNKTKFTFCNSDKIIASLISICFYLNKISEKHQLRIVSLPKNYILNLFLNNQHLNKLKYHYLLLRNLTPKQYLKLKSLVADLNDYFNKLFSSFDNFHKELSFGFQLVDNFSDYFSFHLVTWKNKKL